MTFPDFFLVGAPKCGTTALHAALRAHPEIFMPLLKEPHYFGSDLEGRWFLRDPLAYRELFAPAANGIDSTVRRIGEASVFYLFSRRAAAEIARAAPSARIVILLRDPLTVMHALHAQLYYNGNEPEADFAAALADEPRRRHLASGVRGGAVHTFFDDRYPPELLCYRRGVAFSEQIGRYFESFGREQMLVLRYEDWARAPERTYGELLRFLDVDPHFRPRFEPANPPKQVSDERLHAALMRPPPALRRTVRALLPHGARRSLVRRVQRWNSRPGRPSMDPALRDRLRRELRPEVERLEALLGWDLSAWKEAMEPEVAP